MNRSRIIHAPMNSRGHAVTAPITQYDYGYLLLPEGVELPTIYEIDFSNDEKKGTSLTVYGGAEGAEVPEELIRTGKDVFAFYYFVGDGFGKTEFTWKIPNHCRPSRDGQTPTPTQQSSIDQLIVRSNEAVESAEQSAEEADRSARESAESARASGESALSASNSALSSGEYASNALGYAESASESAQASAQSATASANSATTAQGYASNAQLSATQASNSARSANQSASDALTFANTASNKATEASTSAQTASTKATEASQSASQALGYKNDAESAKTASQTAQGLAESARDTAVSAKTDAESARDDAETARDEAQQAVASISGALDDKAPVITDTASGAIASFSDGADDLPLKSLIVDIEPVQSGSGDPSPDNVRPISGWSEVNVQRTGVNLFPYKDIETQTKNGVTITVEKSDGIITNIHLQGTATTSFSVSFYVNGEDNQWVLPKGEYKLYIGGDKPTQIRTFDINVRKAGTTSDISASSGVTTITLSEQTTFGSAYIWIYSGTVLNNNIIPVIVQSGVDTSVKYPITQRQSITIDLGQTVYGGKLDVLSGVLTVDRVMVDLGTLTWQYSQWGSNYQFAKSIPNMKVNSDDGAIGSIMCSMYPNVIPRYMYRDVMNYAITHNRGFIRIVNTDYTDAASFKTAMSGVQLVYDLAEPIEIQLTPNQVNSLLGVNNLWADSGDTEVEYRADTKLFIERLTAPDSADMVADANITSGQYFMVGNNLFKATANIANGSAIIVGTNCIRKSLSEALNEINA